MVNICTLNWTKEHLNMFQNWHYTFPTASPVNNQAATIQTSCGFPIYSEVLSPMELSPAYDQYFA